MNESLYERYKDALRRGHIAALRGRHEAALAAYSEAAAIAPDRPLPHASLGTTYHRLGRLQEALDAFDEAITRAADDELALGGRADVLLALRRNADAAVMLDRLADVLEREGRIAEALDAARRALELAESRARRRQLRDLVGRGETGPAGLETNAALERARAILEQGPSEPARDAAHRTRVRAADPLPLVAEAEAALDAGDRDAARSRLIEAVRAHRAAEQVDAALDAAIRALALAPLDAELHMALAGIYLDQGWRGLAVDKLALLGRLAVLSDDDDARSRVESLVRARLPHEERLRALFA